MRFAVVNGTLVENIIEAAEGFSLPDRELVEATTETQIGGSYDGGIFSPAPPIIPDRVTARQFKLQLLAASLLDQVEAWIASQSQAVQIAFEYSGTFVRDEPMMQAGFAALNFTDQQIDDFFTAAAAL